MEPTGEPTTPPQRFEREWPEFLDEIRVALPGVQLLFAFLLATPFTSAFERVAGTTRIFYFACFLTTTAACGFLIAPSVYHRLHWRRDVRDKEQMLRTCNLLAIVGVVLRAASRTCAVYVVAVVIAGVGGAVSASAVAAAMFFALWFGLPLTRRSREQRP